TASFGRPAATSTSASCSRSRRSRRLFCSSPRISSTAFAYFFFATSSPTLARSRRPNQSRTIDAALPDGQGAGWTPPAPVSNDSGRSRRGSARGRAGDAAPQLLGRPRRGRASAFRADERGRNRELGIAHVGAGERPLGLVPELHALVGRRQRERRLE